PSDASRRAARLKSDNPGVVMRPWIEISKATRSVALQTLREGRRRSAAAKPLECDAARRFQSRSDVDSHVVSLSIPALFAFWFKNFVPGVMQGLPNAWIRLR